MCNYSSIFEPCYNFGVCQLPFPYTLIASISEKRKQFLFVCARSRIHTLHFFVVPCDQMWSRWRPLLVLFLVLSRDRISYLTFRNAHSIMHCITELGINISIRTFFVWEPLHRWHSRGVLEKRFLATPLLYIGTGMDGWKNFKLINLSSAAENIFYLFHSDFCNEFNGGHFSSFCFREHACPPIKYRPYTLTNPTQCLRAIRKHQGERKTNLHITRCCN